MRLRARPLHAASQDVVGCHRMCEYFAYLRPKTALWSALKEPLAKADGWDGLVATTARTGFADHVAHFPELKAAVRGLYGNLSAAKELTDRASGRRNACVSSSAGCWFWFIQSLMRALVCAHARFRGRSRR